MNRLKTFYNVGKIVNTHGINGEVRVISVTDFPEERYKKGSELLLFKKDKHEPIPLTVKSWRKHKHFDLLTFEGYQSIIDVDHFKGGILKVSEEHLERLEENEYYFHEIIGCTVLDENSQPIGVVKEILTPGANDVWVVKSEEGKEYSI